MLLPQSLTVSELIDIINDLVIRQRRRPTVNEVVDEGLARVTARVHISSDPALPPIPSKKAERDMVVEPSRAKSHVSTPSPSHVKIAPSSAGGSSTSHASALYSSHVGTPPAGGSKPRYDEKESPPVVYSGKYYTVIRGRRVGVFEDPFEEVKQLIEGVPNNYHKGFKTRQAAAAFYYEEKSKGHVAVIKTRGDKLFDGPIAVES